MIPILFAVAIATCFLAITLLHQGIERSFFIIGAAFYALSKAVRASRERFRDAYQETMAYAPATAHHVRDERRQLERIAR